MKQRNRYKSVDEQIVKDQMTVTIRANRPNSVLATALRIGMERAKR